MDDAVKSSAVRATGPNSADGQPQFWTIESHEKGVQTYWSAPKGWADHIGYATLFYDYHSADWLRRTICKGKGVVVDHLASEPKEADA